MHLAHLVWLAFVVVAARACSGHEVHGHLHLEIVESAVKTGAVCLDGSPPAYYYRPARALSSTKKWVLFFRGGAWCDTPEMCLYRAGTTLGSSKYLEPTLVQGGVLSGNSTHNPDFHDWHHVSFNYCDGSSYSSNGEQVVNDTKLFYRGHAILHALMADLFKRGIGSATDVLVSGCSAGGLAVFLHVDEIARMFEEGGRTKVRAMPGSGYFMDMHSITGENVFPEQMKSVFYFQNCSGGVNQDCIKHSPAAPHRCFLAPHAASFVKTPLFLINSFNDKWQMKGVFAAKDPEFRTCALTSLGNCTQQQIDRVTSEFARKQVASISSLSTYSRPGNGAFLRSCWDHCGEVMDSWNDHSIDGVSVQQAVSDWYFDVPNTKRNHLDCYLTGPNDCNPSCSLPEQTSSISRSHKAEAIDVGKTAMLLVFVAFVVAVVAMRRRHLR